ncbi:hypothetical protein DICA1_C13542 [Diutina catenulata]
MGTLLDLPLEVWSQIVNQLSATDRARFVVDYLTPGPHQRLYHHVRREPLEVAVSTEYHSNAEGPVDHMTLDEYRRLLPHFPRVWLSVETDDDPGLNLKKHVYHELARDERVQTVSWTDEVGCPPDIRMKVTELTITNSSNLLFAWPRLESLLFSEVCKDEVLDLTHLKGLRQLKLYTFVRSFTLTLPPSVERVHIYADDYIRIRTPKGLPELRQLKVAARGFDWDVESLPSLRSLHWTVSSVGRAEVLELAPNYREPTRDREEIEKTLHKTSISQLGSLDTGIASLTLSGCQLTEIPDFAGYTSLKYLWADDNRLTSLTVRAPNIVSVNASHNPGLRSFDISPSVAIVNVKGCAISTVSLAQYPNLITLDLRENPVGPELVCDAPSLKHLQYPPSVTSLVMTKSSVPVTNWRSISHVSYPHEPDNQFPASVGTVYIHRSPWHFKFSPATTDLNLVINWYPVVDDIELPRSLRHLRLDRTDLVTFPSLESQTVTNFWPQLPLLHHLTRLEITSNICLDLDDEPVVLPMSVEWVSLNVAPWSMKLAIEFDGEGDTNLEFLSIEHGMSIPLHWSWESIGHGTKTRHNKLRVMRTKWAPGMDYSMPWPDAVRKEVFKRAPDSLVGFYWSERDADDMEYPRHSTRSQ